MLSIQDLREQRAVKAKALKELVSPERKWDDAVDKPIYDAGMKEIDNIDAQIARIEEVNKKTVDRAETEGILDVADRAAKDKKSDGARLWAKWLRGGDKALNTEDWAIYNTMATNVNTQGGYTVETDIAGFVDAMKWYGGMRAVSNVISTAAGNPLQFATSDGTSEVGEIVAENGTATAADPTFSNLSLPVYKYSSKVVTVPFELLQDSKFDVEGIIRKRLVTRLGRITNTHFTTGTGAQQPNGVVTAATTGVTASNGNSEVTAVKYPSIIKLIHSVDPAYRNPNCVFMMNDASVSVIRQVVDGNGRPLFVPTWNANASGDKPFTWVGELCGYNVVTNQDVAVMAASAKSMLFGDFSYYYIRDVMSIEMFRFTDSAYAKAGQVGFLAWMRSGGNLIDIGGAIKLFVNAAS